jgi:hypothetical protein
MDANAWLHSWWFSFLTMLAIVGLFTSFGAFVYALIYRIWGEEDGKEELLEPPGKRDEERAAQAPTLSKAA